MAYKKPLEAVAAHLADISASLKAIREDVKVIRKKVEPITTYTTTSRKGMDKPITVYDVNDRLVAEYNLREKRGDL